MIDRVAAVAGTASGMGIGQWALTVAAVLLFFAGRAQLNPFTRCGRCKGQPPSDGPGEHYRRCPRCEGASERLRFGSWLMLKLGIPVPRARPAAGRNRWGL